MATPEDRELEYYRAAEDFFATLRGVPHTLSPKDFHLLRQWWDDQIPLAAVQAGIAETFAKRRDRGDGEPVVSLSYCRHAVRAQARQIAEMHVGAHDEEAAEKTVDQTPALHRLAERLEDSAREAEAYNPRLAELIKGMAGSVTAAADLPPETVGEHLYALETALLANSYELLDQKQRDEVAHRARAAADQSTTSADGRERAYRAHRDRNIRELLRLPRLEIDG